MSVMVVSGVEELYPSVHLKVFLMTLFFFLSLNQMLELNFT